MNQVEPTPQTTGKPRRFTQKLRRGIVLYAIVPYLSVTAIFAVFQRKLIYRPTVSKDLGPQ